jgi:hypothetical protein
MSCQLTTEETIYRLNSMRVMQAEMAKDMEIMRAAIVDRKPNRFDESERLGRFIGMKLDDAILVSGLQKDEVALALGEFFLDSKQLKISKKGRQAIVDILAEEAFGVYKAQDAACDRRIAREQAKVRKLLDAVKTA